MALMRDARQCYRKPSEHEEEKTRRAFEHSASDPKLREHLGMAHLRHRNREQISDDDT